MARRESLRAYQDEVLKKMEEARLKAVSGSVLYFGFFAGNKHFMVDGNHVIELAPMSVLEPIPIAKPWAVGAANIKGSVYAVTDFSMLTGGERLKRGKFVVLSDGLMPGAALLIEGLSGLFRKEDIGPLGPVTGMQSPPDWISGTCMIGQQHFYMIDAPKLSADPRFSKLQLGDN
jgi:twitching motility protein PilI